jgi:PAS domain S-box-containing protein
LIYQTAPIGLAFLSTDCRYLMINEHLTEICGISVAGHIGRTVRETVPQVADQVEQLVQTIVRTGEPVVGIEVNGQRPDRSNVDRVWITYWHPLKDRSGNVVGINVAAEEITERKRTEAELSASRERLVRLNETLAERVEQQVQERDRIWKLSQDAHKQAQEELSALRRQIAADSRQAAIGAMTASIAHEIKQPLGATVLNAHAALRFLSRPDANLAEARDALGRIIEGVDRINQVIDGIRAMFKRRPGERSLVDPGLLVREVLALAQSELEAHRVTVSNDIRAALPEVMAERVQLQQVLFNLVMNAIESMSAVVGRERRLTIAAGLDQQAASLTLTVQDTGCGIDPDHLPRIFEAFYTTKSQGTGLGLFISRSIAEAHGGRLLASPGTPLGTAFHLILPVASNPD